MVDSNGSDASVIRFVIHFRWEFWGRTIHIYTFLTRIASGWEKGVLQSQDTATVGNSNWGW